jgi:hypothetical protein
MVHGMRLSQVSLSFLFLKTESTTGVSRILGTFPTYLRMFFKNYFGNDGYPRWCVDALRSVGVDLLEGEEGIKVVDGDGAKWEYSDHPVR